MDIIQQKLDWQIHAPKSRTVNDVNKPISVGIEPVKSFDTA